MAFQRERRTFEDPFRFYHVVVTVRESGTCEEEANVIIRTDETVPGDYEENKRIVRLLAMNLDIRPADHGNG